MQPVRHRPLSLRPAWSPHERLELVPNNDYWDKARVPKQDRLVLLPMPEAATRTAALLSGQVNFIEAPSPDAIPRAEVAPACRSSPTSIRTTGTYQLNFVNGPVHGHARTPGGELRASTATTWWSCCGGMATPDYADGAAEPAVLRPSGDLQIRPGEGQGAAEGSRLPAVQGHVRDLHLRLRPDAAAADERAGQVAARGGRVRGRRSESMDWNALLRSSASGVAEIPGRRRRSTSAARSQDPVQRHDQAGMTRANGRPPAATGAITARPRSDDAGQGRSSTSSTPSKRDGVADQDARDTMSRPGGDDLGGARPQSARAVAEGAGLRAGAELVPGPDADLGRP